MVFSGRLLQRPFSSFIPKTQCPLSSDLLSQVDSEFGMIRVFVDGGPRQMNTLVQVWKAVVEVALSLLNVLKSSHTAPENLGPERVFGING
jgi:hypothetical protein